MDIRAELQAADEMAAAGNNKQASEAYRALSQQLITMADEAVDPAIEGSWLALSERHEHESARTYLINNCVTGAVICAARTGEPSLLNKALPLKRTYLLIGIAETARRRGEPIAAELKILEKATHMGWRVEMRKAELYLLTKQPSKAVAAVNHAANSSHDETLIYDAVEEILRNVRGSSESTEPNDLVTVARMYAAFFFFDRAVALIEEARTIGLSDDAAADAHIKVRQPAQGLEAFKSEFESATTGAPFFAAAKCAQAAKNDVELHFAFVDAARAGVANDEIAEACERLGCWLDAMKFWERRFNEGPAAEQPYALQRAVKASQVGREFEDRSRLIRIAVHSDIDVMSILFADYKGARNERMDTAVETAFTTLNELGKTTEARLLWDAATTFKVVREWTADSPIGGPGFGPGTLEFTQAYYDAFVGPDYSTPTGPSL